MVRIQMRFGRLLISTDRTTGSMMTMKVEITSGGRGRGIKTLSTMSIPPHDRTIAALLFRKGDE